MTRLIWGATGERFFETGIDRGVLYTTDGRGVPWNGLTSVKETSVGGEVAPFYLDGLKYMETISREDFAGTIDAFTYPDEFGAHDGTWSLASGLIAMQQTRKRFGLSYRTRVGNDLSGAEHGYKLHLIYNVLAQPADKTYSTLSSSIDPSTFSWDFTTLAKRPMSDSKLAPLAHAVIDSRKTDPTLLRFVEEQLYGSARHDPAMITLDALFRLFENPTFVLSIFANSATGLSQLVLENDGNGDLIGNLQSGLYEALSETRLTPTSVPGLYQLGLSANADARSLAYNPASGLFETTNMGNQDLTDQNNGYYTIPNSSRLVETTTPGIFRLET